MNNLYLRKYYSETLHSEAVGIIQLENDHKTEYQSSRPAGSVASGSGSENLIITKKNRAAMIVDNRTLTAHWKSLIEKYPV